MTIKNLRNKLMITGALLTSLGFGSGCETPGGTVALGTLMQMSPYSSQDEVALGGVIGAVGQMEHEKEVAREGRSQVNVYGGSNSSNYIKYGREPPTCFEWENPNDPNDFRIRPRNSIYRGPRQYSPAPGYVWENPADPENVCTRRIGN